MKNSHSATNDSVEAELRISLLQMDIKWEDKKHNLEKVEKYLSGLSGNTDLVVLPEMFSTGFSMNSKNLAELTSGKTISLLQTWSKQYQLAICGSFIALDNNKYYNRGFFITECDSYFYDKRHLFRMGDETKAFSEGEKNLIIKHKGFNICLLICYDLRFPVWSRNVDNKYDLLIYVASWPNSRIKVWDTLIEARALENISYVCGVNRIGVDGLNLHYNGHSRIVNYRGDIVLDTMDDKECVDTVKIFKKELNLFRNKFPVWKDADIFTLK